MRLNRLRQNQKGLSRGFILIGLVVAIVALAIMGNISDSGHNTATSKEYSAPNAIAILNNSEELYRQLNNDGQFTAIRTDLAVFGRKTISKYKSGKVENVMFTVTNKPSVSDNKVSLEGKYKESKDTISVTITKLSNDRIHDSITNKKTKASIDSELPSNSKRNQYIGSLPIKKATFSISYLMSTKTFFITLNGPDINSQKTEAVKELTTGLEITNLSAEKVSIVGWGANGLPTSLPNPDAPE